ncbi:hypothetical protein [Bosea sp. (in: a-proteobacteria)]|uniref:hypothetical protein n=1 Tax=Bosea sp. (in: a-proteobacteria) TaxID=1871050 RepID=UPI001AD3FF3F|nr:hypothetical protein [Bosea sp. (in: a-proteobacteria)]MBN9438485.1 hypothetical protein [Bosea sp. (in: a-proteobacteria)]
MQSKYPRFPHGASAGHVSEAIALAQANCREEMTGFNVRSKTAKPFASVEEFIRYKLGRAANDAFHRMAPLLKGACVFRLTLTVSSRIRSDRAFHAAGLKTFMKGALREILPSAIAHCTNLHVHHSNYLHVDVTVVVRDEYVERFCRKARISHTLGWRKRLGVRASTCKIIPQGSLETDLRRSLDYTLRYDRYRREPGRTKEAIRAIGVARSSGFKKSRSSKYPKGPAGAINSLNRRVNLTGNGSGSTLPQTQGTTKNPNVASPPRKKRGPRLPGRPSKRSHPAYRRGFRRDREARERDPADQTSRSNQAKHPPRLAIALGLMSSTAVVFPIRPLPVEVACSPPAADGCIRPLGRWKGASTRFGRSAGVCPRRRDTRRNPQPSRSVKRPTFDSGQAPAILSLWPSAPGDPCRSRIKSPLSSPVPLDAPSDANRHWKRK